MLDLLEHYYIEFHIIEAERPAYHKIKEHLKVIFHPDSKTMRSFEHSDEEDSIEMQPATDFDSDAAVPFPGLDAPLGG